MNQESSHPKSPFVLGTFSRHGDATARQVFTWPVPLRSSPHVWQPEDSSQRWKLVLRVHRAPCPAENSHLQTPAGTTTPSLALGFGVKLVGTAPKSPSPAQRGARARNRINTGPRGSESGRFTMVFSWAGSPGSSEMPSTANSPWQPWHILAVRSTRDPHVLGEPQGRAEGRVPRATPV